MATVAAEECRPSRALALGLLAGLSVATMFAAGAAIPSPRGLATSGFIFRDGFELLNWRVRRSSDGSLLQVPCSSGQCAPQQGVASDFPQPGDYDGDGKADFATWRPLDATWRVLRSVDNAASSTPWGAPGDIPIAADYDGDGKIDLGTWRPSDGTWHVLQSFTNAPLLIACGVSMCVPQLGSSASIPLSADFDGDNKADLVAWDSTNAQWTTRLSASGSTVVQAWGSPGDIPVPADFDGDSKTDYAVWRPGDGSWIILRSSSGTQVLVPCGTGLCTPLFGAIGDLPQMADFDGDAKADLAIWRPSDGTWRRVNSSDGSAVTTAWGIASDSPQVGDYDGDGKADPAVVRQ